MDDRIVEILSEVLIELRGVNTELSEMKSELKGVNKRLDKLDDQQAKTNLAIGELRLSVMKLAENQELILHHETRIDALERKVFSK